MLAAGGCTTCCSPVPTFLARKLLCHGPSERNRGSAGNLKLQQVHDVLLASAPFLARKPIGTKLWFCTTISSCSKTCHPMARRDGFRALSLSRKDGGKVKPAQQRSAKKWTLRVKLVAVIFSSFQGAVRGDPSAAAGDRKNPKT
ncbi:uncharacterized protein LOC144152174 isoform X1 [Haemaphysalis longicornis]